jgi:hypothetical protein
MTRYEITSETPKPVADRLLAARRRFREAASVLDEWARDLDMLRPFLAGTVHEAQQAWDAAREHFREACIEYTDSVRLLAMAEEEARRE